VTYPSSSDFVPPAEREYAYGGCAENALQLASQEAWIVVSLKND